MSMAHGLESRVPLLDHPLVEIAASIPADIKFRNGDLKHLLKKALQPYLPNSILQRKDKMGFPVPLNDWLAKRGPAREFVLDVFSSRAARERPLFNNEQVIKQISMENRFGRTTWGMLSLELWQRLFFDQHRPIEVELRSKAIAN